MEYRDDRPTSKTNPLRIAKDATHQLASGRVVEALNELNDRAFATSGCPDEGYLLIWMIERGKELRAE